MYTYILKHHHWSIDLDTCNCKTHSLVYNDKRQFLQIYDVFDIILHKTSAVTNHEFNTMMELQRQQFLQIMIDFLKVPCKRIETVRVNTYEKLVNC